MKQLLILSGKGGTGKTTVAGAFIKLLNAKAYADCDVDAPNLHLITHHNKKPIKKDYYGLPKAHIDLTLCTGCGLCREKCRFDAIQYKDNFYVDENACEGCGVCKYICPLNAIKLNEVAAGELVLYNDQCVFSTAKLKIGSGTSGKLVTKVKKQLTSAAKNAPIAVIDGSPGIGCPVIASLSCVDMALIVAEPSVSGISDMERIIKTARYFGTKIAVCINKYDTNLKNTKTIEQYCKVNEIDFAGKMPYDNKVITAVNTGMSIVEVNCPAATALIKVFENTMKLISEI